MLRRVVRFVFHGQVYWNWHDHTIQIQYLADPQRGNDERLLHDCLVIQKHSELPVNTEEVILLYYIVILY